MTIVSLHYSALSDNQKLSERYQSALTRFVEVKRQALIVLEQKTEMESALRDLKQVLHMWLPTVLLAEYFLFHKLIMNFLFRTVASPPVTHVCSFESSS